MTNGPASEVLQQLCKSLLRDAGGLSDRQLLELFIERRDEAAFEAIVRRHGPMVMGVCRRILRNRQDAEDAFQAAFLVLVRKAAVIASRELLAGWLYGVAYNTALKGKAAAARRRLKERQATAMLETDAETSQPENDWLPVLDRELDGLPDKYRLPIVLCELQGKPHKEAARELGCPIGTLSGRLSRGRTLLAKRLARYGLALTAGSLSAVLAQQEVSASVTPAVVSATVKAATAGAISAEIAALTEGVVKAMFLAKLKMATMILGTVVLLTAAVLTCTALAGGQVPDKGGSTEKPAARPDDKPDKKDEKNATRVEKAQVDGNKDLKSLVGTWNIDTMGWGNGSLSKEQMKGYKFVFADNKLTWDAAFGHTNVRDGIRPTYVTFQGPCDFKIDPSKTPKEIDITVHLINGRDATFPGIYEIKGDALKVCYYSRQLGRRPTEFSSKDDPWIGLITLTRARDKPKSVEDKAKADKIKPGDRIYIYVSPGLPDNPIRAMYEVEASGKVALGPGYGRVLVADMTPEEAEAAIKKSLGALVKNPGVSVSRKPPTPVSEGVNPGLERRVQQLEKEVRALRSALDELQKKPRDQ